MPCPRYSACVGAFSRSLALGMGLAASLAAAQTSITVYSSAAPGVLSLLALRTIGDDYAMPGYATVREERSFDLQAGRNTLRVPDVPALIDPTTVSFTSLTDAAGTRVLDQSFEFDLVSTGKLLARYLGQPITVEPPRGSGSGSITGTLVGVGSARHDPPGDGRGLILQAADGSVRVVNGAEGVLLPSLPGGLVSKPTLVWNLESQRGGTHKARLAYETRGMTWWANYNATLSEPKPGTCRLALGAWVTVVNQSGAGFADARLKLVAGDVQRIREDRLHEGRFASAMAPSPGDGFKQKPFFEYHLYTLARPVSLAQNSVKQIELFAPLSGVACEKRYVYAGQASANDDRVPDPKVGVMLRLTNTRAAGLGMPLPGGRMRISKQDTADGSLEFIGEAVVDHTPVNESVAFRVGAAFDVVGQRTVVNERDGPRDGGRMSIEQDIVIRVRNSKPDETVTVTVRETVGHGAGWTVLRRSHAFEKVDARTIEFPVTVKPGGEAVVRYTVQFSQ